jgi:hypothetical protein
MVTAIRSCLAMAGQDSTPQARHSPGWPSSIHPSANGSDGIRFATSMIKSGTVTLDPSTTLITGFTLKSSQLSGNNNDGVLLNAVTAADVTIQNTDVAENGGDGFAVVGSTVAGAAFLNSSSNANGVGGPGNGISFVDSTIESGVVTLNDRQGTTLTTGFTLQDSQAAGNTANGFQFRDITATDVTIDNTDIAANTLDGVFFALSSVTDFTIRNSHLGRVLGGAFSGNVGHGFEATKTTFDGVAFLDSFFNGNGNDQNAGDGIRLSRSTISSKGFALSNSQVVGNHADGVEFDAVDATNIAFKKVTLAGNAFDGLAILDTDTSDSFDSISINLVIQDSILGGFRDQMGIQHFAGNGQNGFFGGNTAFTGVAFLNSSFNANGSGQSRGNGIFFLDSTINSGMVTPDGTIVPLATGFTLKDSELVGNIGFAGDSGNGIEFNGLDAQTVTIEDTTIASNGHDGVLVDPTTLAGFAVHNALVTGNAGNGVEITDSTVDDVSFDGGTQISDNGGAGVLIAATGLDGTNGSILFGDAAITGNMTGIMVENDDAMAPLLLTFETTRIGGGVDGLVLSGSGIALTGGGGTIPGGSTVGGGNTAGDGLFGGSLGALAFTDQTGDFIRLENGALFAPGTPTVIDASNVTFNGALATSLTAKQRNQIEHKVVEFNDVNTLGLIFLPQAVQTAQMLPSPAEVRDVIKGLPRKENTPGDTLFLNTEGLKFSTNPGQPNAFCFRYSMADPTGHEDEKKTCLELSAPPARVTPNGYLHDFWRGWQASRL